MYDHPGVGCRVHRGQASAHPRPPLVSESLPHTHGPSPCVLWRHYLLEGLGTVSLSQTALWCERGRLFPSHTAQEPNPISPHFANDCFEHHHLGTEFQARVTAAVWPWASQHPL
jgi:hypothetical protein